MYDNVSYTAEGFVEWGTVPQCVCESQRTTLWTWFSPATFM